MNQVNINGKTYNIPGNCSSISVIGNKVTINGETIGEDINDTLIISNENITIITDKNVSCKNVIGTIKATGNVNCNDVTGNIKAGGSVHLNDIVGNIVADKVYK